jgi:hypothetical protein
MGVSKCCCCVNACSFPPGGSKGDGLPCIAICNQRCGGEDELADLEEAPSEMRLLLDQTFLIQYCCCSGFGCLCGAPLCKGTTKCCCLHGNYETADFYDPNKGCCYCKSKLCCSVNAYAFPPGGGAHDGLPMFACCGQKCCDDEPKREYAEDSEEELEEPEQEEM